MAGSSRHQSRKNQCQGIISEVGKKSPKGLQQARSALGWGAGKHDAGDPSRLNRAKMAAYRERLPLRGLRI